MEWVENDTEMFWVILSIERKNIEFVKKVYVSVIVGPRRGRPVVRWKDRVKEYMHERVADRGERLN